MATVTNIPGVVTAVNEGRQDLFTINQTDGVTRYDTVGNTAVVLFDLVYNYVGDGSVSPALFPGGFIVYGQEFTGAITTYQLIGQVYPNWQFDPANPPLITFVDYNTFEPIGPSGPVTQPLIISYTNTFNLPGTGDAVYVALVISNANGANFAYPQQLFDSMINIVEQSSYISTVN